MSTLEFRTAVAIKKHAGLKLRKAGITDPDGFEPHRLEWRDLNAAERAVAEISREVLDQMSGAADETLASLTAAHDGLMSLYDLIASEKDGRTASGNREPRSQSLTAARRPTPKDMTCYGGDDGHWYSAREADEAGSETAIALQPEERFSDWACRQPRAARSELAPGQLLRAFAFGARTDPERRALNEGTDSAGGLTVPTVLSAEFIDRLRRQSVLIRAGARTIPLTSDQNTIAKLASDPTPAWRAEAASIAISDPTFAAVTLAPKSLAVMVKFSRELLADSLNIEAALLQAVTQAMALELDRAGLFGSGADNIPRGVANVSGINSIDCNGSLSGFSGGVYGPLVAARTALLSANAGEPSAFVLHPREDGTIVRMLNGNGDPVQAPARITAIPALVSTAVPINAGAGTNEGTIIAGNFRHLLIGMRENLRLEILRERYAETGELALVAHLRADFAVEHPLAFCAVVGIEPEA